MILNRHGLFPGYVAKTPASLRHILLLVTYSVHKKTENLGVQNTG